MKKRYALFWLASLGTAFICGCAMLDDGAARANPYDPGGTDWKKNSNPIISVAMDSIPLWYDYDHDSGKGTIQAIVRITDKNGSYDSLTIKVWSGNTLTSMDSFPVPVDSVWDFIKLTRGTRYYYRINATDTWDSTTTVTGSFTTPTGIPPKINDSCYATSFSTSILLTWGVSGTGTVYTLYRSTRPEGAYFTITDTITTSPTISYSDQVPDYRDYYYIISATNDYGTCRLKTPLTGYRYSTSVSTPSSLSATGYGTFIRLSWYGSYNRYYIHRGTGLNGPFFTIDSTIAATYSDTLRGADTGYYYRVSARSSSGQRSGPTAVVYGVLGGIGTPSSISASDGTYAGYIRVSWSTVTGAAGYYIHRAPSYSGTYFMIGESATTLYNDTVTTNDTYYYKIQAYDSRKRIGNLSSGYDGGYPQRLPTPSGISVSNGTYPNYIRISWAAVTGATGYYIFRSVTYNHSDSLKLIDSTATTSYLDSVTTGDNYYYAVVAHDANGKSSGKSSLAVGYLQRPAAPQTVTSSTTSYTDIFVSWSTVSNASGYYVYRSTSSAGPYSLIDSTSTSSYRDTTVQPDSLTGAGKYYYYKIAAYTATGIQGTWSTYTIGSIKGLDAPISIRIVQYRYKNKIPMDWGKVPLATGYSIYRSVTANGTYRMIATVTDTFFTDDSLDLQQTTFYYKFVSIRGSVTSQLSGYFIGNRLSAPLDFTATPVTGHINLSWKGFPDSTITGYSIQRSTDSVNFNTIGQFPRTVVTFTDSTSAACKLYYRIFSYSLYDTSDARTIISQNLPGIPSNFRVIVHGDTATLSWDSVPYAIGYYVYSSTYSASPSLYDATHEPHYLFAGLSAGTPYNFAVAAVNFLNLSGPNTHIITTRIGLTPPSMPEAFSVTGYMYAIALSWNAPPSGEFVTGYCLHRSADSGKNYSLLDSVFTRSYVDSVSDGRLYFYRVSAFNNAGESPLTPIAIGKRQVPDIPANLSLNGSQQSTHVPLIWSSVSGAAGYCVYRTTSSTGSYLKIDTALTTIHNDSTGLNSTVYYYKVSAFNAAGESVLSNFVSGMKSPATVPTGLKED